MASGMFRSVLVAALIAGLSGLALAQDWDEEPDPTILRIALADAATTLEQGMAASEGKPISAKFEMPNGDVQLSVYTASDDGFVETVLNPKTGVVISAEPITDPDDLAHAKAQKAVMDRATMSLLAAIERAIQENTGARAVGVVPELRNGQPLAVVTLQRLKGFLNVSERLN